MEKSSINIRSVLFSNLKLLIEDEDKFKKTYKIEISENSFDIANNKNSLCVLHFLVKRMLPNLPKDTFQHVWPIVEKNQESEFKKIVTSLLESISNQYADFMYPQINNSTLLNTSGTRFCIFLIRLTSSILQKEIIETDKNISIPYVQNESDKSFLKIFKTMSKEFFKRNVQKISEELDYQERLKLYWEKASQYFENVFKNYQNELKEIKSQQKLFMNKSSMSEEGVMEYYKKIEDIIEKINLTVSEFSPTKTKDIIIKPCNLKTDQILKNPDANINIKHLDFENIKYNYSDITFDKNWEIVYKEIKNKIAKVDHLQETVDKLINNLPCSELN